MTYCIYSLVWLKHKIHVFGVYLCNVDDCMRKSVFNIVVNQCIYCESPCLIVYQDADSAWQWCQHGGQQRKDCSDVRMCGAESGRCRAAHCHHGQLWPQYQVLITLFTISVYDTVQFPMSDCMLLSFVKKLVQLLNGKANRCNSQNKCNKCMNKYMWIHFYSFIWFIVTYKIIFY